ncbi:MAG: serine/threonine protein kinase, partial [Candidatus Obscuribacterales bacterium]|nr:serine/threonine protein kinase [Candidatus Obscuribacterales bacterium]
YHYGIALDGSPYAVMEYLEGKSLSDTIRDEVHLSSQRACKIMKQICSALALAHKLGIIHRDLKPDNIILLSSPEPDFVKILDFGLSSITEASDIDSERLTKTGLMVGSPLYMSPEQCRGERADDISDIYSCGCIIYEMITGETVFEDNNQIAILGKDCPAAIEAVCRKCLEKDKHKRYQSMDELSSDLEAIETGQEEKLLAAFPSSKKSVPIKFVIAFGIVLLIIVATAVSFYSVKTKSKSGADEQKDVSTAFAQQLKNMVKTGSDTELRRFYSNSTHSSTFFQLSTENKQQLLASYLETFSKNGKDQLAFETACQLVDMEIKFVRNPGISYEANHQRVDASNVSYCNYACRYLSTQNLSERQWKTLDKIFETQRIFILPKLYDLIALQAKTHDEYKIGEAERVDKTQADYEVLLQQDVLKGDMQAVEKSLSKIVALQKKYKNCPVRLYVALIARGQLWLIQNNIEKAKADLNMAQSLQTESCPSPAEFEEFTKLKIAIEKATASSSKK